jgi:hypothetical protein
MSCSRLTCLSGTLQGEKMVSEKVAAVASLQFLQTLNLEETDCTFLTPAIEMIAVSCRHLMDVRLQMLLCDTVMEFVHHCPQMRIFAAELFEPLRPALLDAIAAHWPDLCGLGLQQTERVAWSDVHDAAVVNLIQRLPKLKVFAVVDGPLPNGVAKPFYAAAKYVDRKIPVTVPLALRYLHMTSMSASALSTVIAHSPGLRHVFHNLPPTPDFLSTLAVSPVRSVGFSGRDGVNIDELSDLRKFAMWDIEDGMVAALGNLASRSPELVSLALVFRQRPSVSVFPCVLCHTDELEELTVSVGKSEQNADDDGDWAPDDAEFAYNVSRAMEHMARLLLPDLGYCTITL